MTTATTTRDRPHLATLRSTLRLWEKGELSKEGAERRFGVTNAHGKWITRQWFARLGVDTRNGKVKAPATDRARRASHRALIASPGVSIGRR